MELRALMLLLRLLDPRRWRLRLAQLTGGLLGVVWVVGRSVALAERTSAVREARRLQRSARIRGVNRAAERRALAERLPAPDPDLRYP